MPIGYTRSPKLLKGALVEFSERFLGPVPNVIVFQYNPETLTRNLSPWSPRGLQEGANPSVPCKAASSAQPGDPSESFNLTLELDATDDLETGDPIAIVSGVADRIAAMEMLLYPQGESLLGGLVEAVGDALGLGGDEEEEVDAIPRQSVPVVLFVWGPGRIVPVRLTSFSVEEQAYSPTLFPIRAQVTVEFRVLTDKDFPNPQGPEEVAVAAYTYMRKQKQVLAAANLSNSVDSILGMLPF